MVEFEREYRFSNDYASYVAVARTMGCDTGYGNDTMLRIELENDRSGRMAPLLLDIRYSGVWTAEGVDRLVRDELGARYGARF